ncbi:MAG: bifunctional sugar-1-phosphate nucleotidylyltransferase/acetyltransferase [Thermoplasmata archaeon]
MKAFILAAGKGTRMMPLTSKTPKPLLPVAGKPILQHTIDILEERLDEIIILVGWQAKRLKDELHSDKADLKYVRQDKLLGTADAIDNAKKYIDGNFICMNGDVIISEDTLNDFIDYFKEDDSCVIGLAEVDEPSSFGVVVKEGEVVKDIIEKPEEPPSNLINAGLYGFTQEIFEAIDQTEKSPRGEYEITDSLKIMIDKSKLRGFDIENNNWFELSRPWDLLSTNKYLLKDGSMKEKREGKIEDGVHLEGWVRIEEDALIKQGAYIKGPVYISEGAEIGPNCLIRAHTYIGKNCKVGNAVEVKNSIIMGNTNVPHHNYVGDSVLGRDCNMGSGTKVANLRLDEKNIIVTHRGEKIDTGRRKLGVVMGDDVKTGINSMIDTGTIIGEGTFIGPGALAKGEIGERSRIQ